MSSIHHGLINISLHGLGYDNAFLGLSGGEGWFIKKVLKKRNPKAIIDVGANVGKYSRYLFENTKATIYSIEPNPNAFQLLSKLPNRVIKINSAITDKIGYEELNFGSDLDERASLNAEIRIGKTVLVRTTTLKDIAKKFNLVEIDLVKIDVEGYELEVLKGLNGIKPKFIQFEFNYHHLKRNQTLREITNELPGYKFYRLLPRGWIQIDPSKYLNNIFMYSNIIAVRGHD